LFTSKGQAKADVKKETMLFMMFSDQGADVSHYMSFGETSRIYGQSGRFPTGQLVDTYEMANGKRIDEAGSGYNPKKPFESRDSRLKQTIWVHHDTIIGNSGGTKYKFLMELFKPTTKSFAADGTVTDITNKDYTWFCSSIWLCTKRCRLCCGRNIIILMTKSLYTPHYNILLLRYAEVLLTYAEAKIELGDIDASVISAIDKVRLRSGQPGILTVDPSRAGNQTKMRQIVRRERKVELAKEMGMLFDMRRWRTGAIQNAEPTFGFLQPHGVNAATNTYPDGYDQAPDDLIPSYGVAGSEQDLNDIPSYKALYAKFNKTTGEYNLRTRDASRSWDDKFYLWPIPQTERNKCPWLTQNSGYGE
jgi:hypothetical protein